MRECCLPFFVMTEHRPEDQPPDPDQDKSYQNRLYPEDQARVDEFLQKGVNSVERKPFRPWLMIIMLIVVVTGFSLLSQLIARWSGIY